jgi:hypothetical protein
MTTPKGTTSNGANNLDLVEEFEAAVLAVERAKQMSAIRLAIPEYERTRKALVAALKLLAKYDKYIAEFTSDA